MRARVLAAIVMLLEGCYLVHSPQQDSAPITPGDAVLAAGNGATSNDLPGCVRRTLRAGERFEPVDMVWVVDSSRSMGDEQARITQTMNQFATDAEQRNFDLHLVMVTARNIVPAPLGSDATRYRFVQHDVGSHDALQALLDERPRYADFLRASAALHFVVVTDDDSDSNPDAFRKAMEAALGRSFVLHAVDSPDVNGQPCRNENVDPTQCGGTRGGFRLCGAAAIGRAYNTLAGETGGLAISICISDWSQVFGPLLDAVTPVAIPCAVELDATSDLDLTTVELRSNGAAIRLPQVAGAEACFEHPAFFYVAHGAGAVVTLCPTACAATGAQGAELGIDTACE